GTETYPDQNFYIEPDNVKKLANTLLSGDFCLLYGHRQSGKSTTAHTTYHYLRNKYNVDIKGYGCVHPEVYLISLNSAVEFNSGINSFWLSICSKLRFKNPARFAFDNNKARATTFESFFQRNQSSSLVILLIDEASILVNQDQAIIDSFIGMLRLLKGNKTCCLHGLVLIGSKALNNFLNLVKATPKYHHIYKRESGINLNTESFATDIYKRTIGHKGLVGVCCCAVEEIVGPSSIVHALLYLSETQMNMLVQVLHFGSAIVSCSDALNKLLLE
ncbi:10895_t:CDS:2, partial [Dentiscutata erythropus]